MFNDFNNTKNMTQLQMMDQIRDRNKHFLDIESRELITLLDREGEKMSLLKR